MAGVNALYRFFDAEDTLLYVGRTANPPSRFREHAQSKAWWETVAVITIETFPDAESLDYAERKAIANDAPLHNIALNPEHHTATNAQKKETLEWCGWTCVSNAGSGRFVRPERPAAFYTRAAAWALLQR